MLNVVMTACNRLPLLRQSLESLVYTSRDIAISIVVIDDSTDLGVRSWLLEFTRKCPWIPFRYDTNPSPHCIGAAKNYGVALASSEGRGDLIYISDSDTYYTPLWYNPLLRMYGYHGGDCPVIGGWNHPYLKPTGHIATWNNGTENYKLETYDAIAGVSWLLSWDAWDKYGPFAANALGPRQSEDWEFCQRVRADGKLVGAVSPWPVLHTGLTDSQGKRAPGSEIYAKEIPWGVLAE